MSSLKKLRIWRSTEELENSPEFLERVQREFPTPLETLPPNSPERRRFMQIMGASLGLAGLSGCRWHEDKLLPLTRRPEGTIPGTTRRFATAMELNGVGVGLHATSFEGRPIKIDGNPVHPESLGGSGAYHQASVLELYDPDRSDVARRRAGGGKPSDTTVKAFVEFAKPEFKRLIDAKGAGLRVLATRSSSPTLDSLKAKLAELAPEAKWVTYEPTASDGARAGSVLAFGKPHRTLYDFTGADVVLTLDADVASDDFPGGLVHARSLAKRRDAESEMNRVYAVESHYSQVGAFADHRLALRAELVKAFAAALDAEVGAKAQLPDAGTIAKPSAQFLGDAKVQKFLSVVAKDLLSAVGKSVVVAGQDQPAEVHAIAHRLNAMLGNVGRTVFYVEDPQAGETSDVEALAALTAELAAGKVDTLLILGGNPVYTAPPDVGFAEALSKAKTSVHLSLYDDETSARTSWHVPAAHYLESWGDTRAWDGTISIIQPLIAPLHGGLSAIEVVALLVGEPGKPLELVQRTLKLGSDKAFRKAVHDGVVASTAYPRVTPALSPVAVKFSERELGGLNVGNGQLEVVFAACPKIFDGRFNNNGWLQELPAPMTLLTWDNAVMVNPATGRELGVSDGKPVTLTVGGKSVTLPVLFIPGHAVGSLRVQLGYGRKRSGRVGGHEDLEDVAVVGADLYPLRTKDTLQRASNGSLAASSADLGRLSTTTDIWALDPIGHQGRQERLPQIVRSATLEEYRKEPHFVDHAVHHPPLLNLWQDPVSYEGHKWGMAIDINKCTGCNGCVTACQAENNIPVTGRKAVSMGREMLWLRIDRYYAGEEENPNVVFQPMPCQHCENAPCEQVCPVGATMHSSEGLNDMTYNRCIGTRYCANNCPYKVRRFNFFNFNLDVIGTTPFTPTTDPDMKLKSMVYNPEVTLRSRGVMEKCTFCVQRIQNVKIKAKNEKRPIQDGEIKTACQEACSTEAIVFGDLNDPKSKVAKLSKIPRAYHVLGELNNRPRVSYLAKIRNPHPELG
jgi:molybdopterin-containing oxidoreductase family iron-sulfur binding subunit